ncbi:MAG TPA: phospholipid carrier-dependent glycosyltransferase [Drouetiella sp.]
MSGSALSVSQLVNQQVKSGSEQTPESSSFDSMSTLALPAVVLGFAALVPIWFSFDHRIPTIDESGHILNAFTYADLFRHPRLLRVEWWHQILSVNSFYPPFAHMTNGMAKAIFGGSRSVDIAVLTFWNAVLSLSVFGISLRLTKSKLSALMSAIMVNLYPELALLNRSFWLDFPLISMIALGLFSLFNFRAKPNWIRALVAGIVLGFACMTKQIAAAYLALPALFVFAEPIAGRTKYLADSVKVLFAGVVSIAIGAPWFILNAEKAKLMADDCAVHISQPQTFAGNLDFYSSALPVLMSPLLVAFMVGAIVFSWQTVSRQLLPVVLSAVGGVLAVSTLSWITPKMQYIAPALITCAVVSGTCLAGMFEHKSKLIRVLGGVFLVAAVAQILSLELAPYPVSQPEQLADYAKVLNNRIAEPRLGMTLVNPSPAEDWGQYWALKQVEQADKKAPVWINILSNSPDLNVHTFELLVHDLNMAAKPTTSRIYTIGGDTATFSPTQALYYQWYLIQSENHYQGFANASAEKAFEQLKNFVKTDSRFKLVGTHGLPDGSTLSLYRQK